MCMENSEMPGKQKGPRSRKMPQKNIDPFEDPQLEALINNNNSKQSSRQSSGTYRSVSKENDNNQEVKQPNNLNKIFITTGNQLFSKEQPSKLILNSNDDELDPSNFEITTPTENKSPFELNDNDSDAPTEELPTQINKLLPNASNSFADVDTQNNDNEQQPTITNKKTFSLTGNSLIYTSAQDDIITESNQNEQNGVKVQKVEDDSEEYEEDIKDINQITPKNQQNQKVVTVQDIEEEDYEEEEDSHDKNKKQPKENNPTEVIDQPNQEEQNQSTIPNSAKDQSIANLKSNENNVNNAKNFEEEEDANENNNKVKKVNNVKEEDTNENNNNAVNIENIEEEDTHEKIKVPDENSEEDINDKDDLQVIQPIDDTQQSDLKLDDADEDDNSEEEEVVESIIKHEKKIFDNIIDLNSEVKNRVDFLVKIGKRHFPATKDTKELLVRLVEQSHACHEFHFIEKRIKYYEKENRKLNVAILEKPRKKSVIQKEGAKLAKELSEARKRIERLKSGDIRIQQQQHYTNVFDIDDEVEVLKIENQVAYSKEKEGLTKYINEVNDLAEQINQVEKRIALMRQKKSKYSKKKLIEAEKRKKKTHELNNDKAKVQQNNDSVETNNASAVDQNHDNDEETNEVKQNLDLASKEESDNETYDSEYDENH